MPTPTVDVNEVLHRQVGTRGNPIYYDPARNPPVHRSAFLPTDNDTDGLSLIRDRFRSEIWSAHRLEQPSVRFRLVALRATRLEQLALESGFLALNYSATPDGLDERFGEPWAHCVVVEINRTDYDADPDAKKRIKGWAERVANSIAGQDIISPTQEPTDRDPYRPTNVQA